MLKSKLVVVDTNVAIVANNKETPQASPNCILDCIAMIKEITAKSRILVLDNSFEIIKEYRHKLDEKGQPGVGDEFLKWVLTNWRNDTYCVTVSITKNEDGLNFKEFPNTDPELEKFDPSDRKFVAVALAHPSKPTIVNAVDSDWSHFEKALTKHGLNIHNICPEVIKKQKSN
jgi:hypothetical protein